jgi:tetrahydromethanopterin S-methyltransferase subunit F
LFGKRKLKNTKMSVLTTTETQTVQETTKYEWKLIWRNIILYTIMHVTGFYGLYLAVVSAQWKTILWSEYLSTICTRFDFAFFSLDHAGLRSSRSHRRKSPSLVPQKLQSQATFENYVGNLPYLKPPEPHLRLGP